MIAAWASSAGCTGGISPHCGPGRPGSPASRCAVSPHTLPPAGPVECLLDELPGVRSRVRARAAITLIGGYRDATILSPPVGGRTTRALRSRRRLVRIPDSPAGPIPLTAEISCHAWLNIAPPLEWCEIRLLTTNCARSSKGGYSGISLEKSEWSTPAYQRS